VIVWQVHDVVGARWNTEKSHQRVKVLTVKRANGEEIDIALFEHVEKPDVEPKAAG
jgi:hypothetical protein